MIESATVGNIKEPSQFVIFDMDDGMYELQYVRIGIYFKRGDRIIFDSDDKGKTKILEWRRKRISFIKDGVLTKEGKELYCF